MEQQVRAEREKRAEILKSEGEKESRINLSKGEREEAINLSRGERQRRINEADGRAAAIESVSAATAEGIVAVSGSIQLPKGKQAVSLRIAEQFIAQLGNMLEHAETQVLPFDIAQIKALFDTVTGKLSAPPAPRSSADPGTRTEATGASSERTGIARGKSEGGAA